MKFFSNPIIERSFFFIIVLLFASPLLVQSYFPTNDGPAHIYNSHLILEFITGNSNIVSQLYQFNSHIEPNWIGHFLFVLFDFFFSSSISERLLVAICMVSLPISIRYFCKSTFTGKTYAAYLAIPFGYNFILVLGFYNFCLGLSILFFALAYLNKSNFTFKGKSILVLFFFGIVLYFSHLIVYAIFLCILTTGILLYRRFNLKNLLFVFLSQLPLILLCLLFYIFKSGSDTSDSMDLNELLKWFYQSAPLLLYVEDSEKWFGLFFNFTLAGILIVGLLTKLNLGNLKNDWKKASLIGLSIFIILLLYFFFPNSFATGGFISIRLLLLFYLFLFGLLSYFSIHKIILIPTLTLFLFVTFYQQLNRFNVSRELSFQVEQLMSAESHIHDNSILLPLNYSNNWLHSNISNYLGSNKLILVLDNYEAATPHFPLKWKNNLNPMGQIGNFGGSKNPTIDIEKYESKYSLHIDYITRWYYDDNTKDSTNLKTNQKIKDNFRLIYRSPNDEIELFKRKK